MCSDTPTAPGPAFGFGDVIRGWALRAWSVPEEAMTEVEAPLKLPLAAAMQGMQASRAFFATDANPYEAARRDQHPIAYATKDRTGFDMVRGAADAPFGRIQMTDCKSFMVFSATSVSNLAGEILNLTTEPEFGEPDGSGWSTTAPVLRVENMTEWHQRLDMYSSPDLKLFLLFKTFPSSRAFAPSVSWF
jgi:hypothetical protein